MAALLVVAASARALAASAARSRAWPRVVAVDLFGDLDLRAVAEWHPPDDAARGRPTLRGCLATVARLCAGGGVEAVLAGGGLEHHPEALRRAAGGTRLLGPDPAAVAAVRDPRRLFAWAREAGVAAPATWVAPDAPPPDAQGPFLRKPRASGGGHGIRPWRPGGPLRRGTVVQARLEGGLPVGASALADGRGARLLGLAAGLAGDAAFGARGFAYAGSLLGPLGGPRHEALAGEAERIASGLAAAFGLRGLFGVDFLLAADRLYLLEVNPRYTASMELIEEVAGASLVDLHAAALAGHLPPAPDPWRRAGAAGFRGKGVVYAERAAVAPDTRGWLAAGRRDVPPPGTRLARGSPVCTVFAPGADAGACLAALRREAEAVRAALTPW